MMMLFAPLLPASHHQHLLLRNPLIDLLEGELLRPFAGGRVLLHRRHSSEHAQRKMVRLPSSGRKFGLGKVREIFLVTTSEKASTEEEEEENCKG